MPRNKVTRKKHPSYYKPNGWRAIADVLIASMNRGQLPVIMFVFLLFVIILKMPSEDASTLAFAILDQLKRLRLLGWALSLIFMFLWFNSSRRLRKSHSTEFKRVGKKKKELQEKLTLRKLDSSN